MSWVFCPSSDEGFDVPALLGLASGARVILSDIPVHREIFETLPRVDFDADLDRIFWDLDSIWNLPDVLWQKERQRIGDQYVSVDISGIKNR